MMSVLRNTIRRSKMRSAMRTAARPGTKHVVDRADTSIFLRGSESQLGLLRALDLAPHGQSHDPCGTGIAISLLGGNFRFLIASVAPSSPHTPTTPQTPSFMAVASNPGFEDFKPPFDWGTLVTKARVSVISLRISIFLVFFYVLICTFFGCILAPRYTRQP